MSFAISRSAPACALLSCLLAAAAHAGSPHTALPAANPNAPVPPTQYQSSAAYQPLAAEPATPDQAWREQNRIVGAGPGRDHTTHGHAGHAMPQAAPVDPHAGHAMPAAAAADPHAGHTMPVPAPAPAPAQADPHAGHAMHHAAPAPAAHQHEGRH
jgi:copper resistance protein B